MDYVLPLKVPPGTDVAELAHYVAELVDHVDVVVVDGSAREQFAQNRVAFGGARHVPPAPEHRCLNGKVAGVRTGLQLCRSDVVIIADDDVRYDRPALDAMAGLLETADVVVPQNYFAPLPWHARWDTARTLINRGLWRSDFPGTLGLRLSAELRDTGYDGDVLFENLELIRTVSASGGTRLAANEVFVRRLPPSTRHFLGQRVRQAYDSQAQPARCLTELAILPATVALGLRHRRLIPAGVVAVLATAEHGRRRGGGRAVFPASATLFAPAWVLERAVCVWVGLYLRISRRGIDYAGRRLVRPAHSVRWLSRNRASVNRAPQRVG